MTMGWFTTSGGENMRGKVKRVAKEKAGDAKDAVKPNNIVNNARVKRGAAVCAGCGKPITGVKAGKANVHKKASCQKAAAKGYKSIMDRDW